MPPQGMPVVALPTPGVVGGRPKKQPLVDTEVAVGAVAVPTEIIIFNNFASFRAAPANTNVTQTKQFGRDCNLKSSGGGTLPQSSFFYWYSWCFYIKTYLTDLNDETNVVAFEEIHRLRSIGSVTFQFQQTDLIVMPLDELPSGTGVASWQNSYTEVMAPSLVNGGWEGRDVTVSGRPVGIEALQQFSVIARFPQATGLTPTVDYFLSSRHRGLLIQGLV